MNARDMHAEMARWIENVAEPDLAAELSNMAQAAEAGDDSALVDAFFQDLSFGTAGLRGTLGAGTNRMNIYTVGRARIRVSAHFPCSHAFMGGARPGLLGRRVCDGKP